MAVDPWSNDACRGYVIWTMENSGFKPKEITQADTDSNEIAEKKKRLIKQGYLVVTIIEGKENMEKGLREIVKNHFH